MESEQIESSGTVTAMAPAEDGAAVPPRADSAALRQPDCCLLHSHDAHGEAHRDADAVAGRRRCVASQRPVM